MSAGRTAAGSAAIEVLVDRQGPWLRAAALAGGRLTLLHIDRTDRPGQWGAIHLAKVQRVLPGMNAVTVDLAGGITGLLSLGDVRGPQGRPKRGEARIGQAVRPGQAVLVQVKAAGHGAKGPQMSMDITLPGRFLVATPLAPGIRLSRRLAQGEERQRVRQLVEQATSATGGWIVRAGAAEVAPDILAAEAEQLHLLWRDIERAALAGGEPRLISPGPAALPRLLQDLGDQRPTQILVAPQADPEAIRRWCADHAPDLAATVSVAEPALFDRADLDSAIAALADRRVPLAGGGWLAIDRTEALTVIDVNSGDRPNAVDTNLAAAREIARQLRLRNISGIVIVDFISLAKAADRQYLLESLAAACAADPAATDVYGMSRLGLVEMTRARRGPMLCDVLEET